jgi:two-component system, response regulator, stage 0 sporulation protein F
MRSISSINVLYVDDEPINLELFKIVFRKYFNVLVADSGFEGIKILEENSQIDAVISDMKMPLMTGLEFITNAHQRNSSILFFLLSGYNITDEIEQAINKGLVRKYIQKPFEKSNIIDILKEQLGVTDN